MKRIIQFSLLLLITLPSISSPNPHLFDFGGYGGPELRLTSVNGDFAVMMGGRGGWIINHKLVIGGGGWSTANNLKLDSNIQNPLQLNMKYGGITFEYYFSPEDFLHFGVDALVGGGNVSLRENNSNREIALDRFFVFEPGVNLFLNVSRYVRISLGANYRFISLAHLKQIGNSDLSGPAIRGTLKFGLF